MAKRARRTSPSLRLPPKLSTSSWRSECLTAPERGWPWKSFLHTTQCWSGQYAPIFLRRSPESSGLVRARGFVPVRQAPVDNMGVRPRVDDGVVAVLKASAAVPNQPGRREPPAAL